jgi:hypothetical protein
LIGKRVGAKRLGWDDPPGGLVRNGDILSWPEWRLSGEPAECEGTLSSSRLPAGKYNDAATFWEIGIELVDPKTVEPLE